MNPFLRLMAKRDKKAHVPPDAERIDTVSTRHGQGWKVEEEEA